MSNHKMATFGIGTFGLVLALTTPGLSSCRKDDGATAAPAEAPATRVELVAAATHHFSPYADLSGEIRPSSLANLTTQVEGNIVKLTVDEGDKVKPGQLLALIDDSVPRANLQR